MREHSVVRLKVDLPDHGLHAGNVGVVLFLFDNPYRAAEVEFSDEKGMTLAELALPVDQLEVLD